MSVTLGQERIGTVVRSSVRGVAARGSDERLYTLERVLGLSSTSAVYEAVRDDGARFALKILHPTLALDDRVLQRFVREAFVTTTIDHHAIVRVHDDGVHDGTAFLVLELLTGETLEERRARSGGKLLPTEIVPLAIALLDVLEAVHAAEVVHRDVKPQNVFLTEENELKLLDFGTARILGADAAADSGEPISVEGLVFGTPSFMSPEQARGESATVDHRADLWSLGATLFLVLAGTHVHLGREAHQRLIATATRPARSLARAAPELDARLVAVVDRALAFDRADRWPDCRSMRAAFELLC